MAVWVFVLVLTASATGVWALLVAMYARMLLSPPRMTNAKAFARLGRMSPRDVGLEHQEWSYRGAEGATIAGWWIPAQHCKRTVVVLHSFGDAKVGALVWAAAWRNAGFNLLMLDLRAHGDSGGTYLTGGRLEAQDVALGLVAASEAFGEGMREVVLFGVSYGAAVACRTIVATEVGQAWAAKGKIRGLVIDSPVATFARGALSHAQQLALPGPWVGYAALRVMAWRAGVKASDAAATTHLPGVGVPGLMIVPTRDAYIAAADRAALRDAFARGPGRRAESEVWEPDATHLTAVNVCAEEYRERLGAFVRRVFEPS